MSTLQELCTEHICNNFDKLTESTQMVLPDGTRLDARKFKYGGFLADQPTHQLLAYLDRHGRLNDANMALFTGECTRLREVTVNPYRNPSLSWRGLLILNEHNITALRIPHVTMEEVLQCIRDKRHYLTTLHCLAGNTVPHSVATLNNLVSLSVCKSNLDNNGLKAIVQRLPRLRDLDISSTSNVYDISALKDLKNLRHLNLHDTKALAAPNTVSVLSKLENLRYLDLGQKIEPEHTFQTDIWAKILGDDDELIEGHDAAQIPQPDAFRTPFPIDDFLENVTLDELEYLDLSGCIYMDVEKFSDFLTKHTKLKFLGLLYCMTAWRSMFTIPFSQHYRPDIKVAGLANDTQMMCALKTYMGTYYESHYAYLVDALSGVCVYFQPDYTLLSDFIEAFSLGTTILHHYADLQKCFNEDFYVGPIVKHAVYWLGVILQSGSEGNFDTNDTLATVAYSLPDILDTVTKLTYSNNQLTLLEYDELIAFSSFIRKGYLPILMMDTN